MRAKFINEFERGLDPKRALGIGPRVAKIRKCFRDLDVSDKYYTITPTAVIFDYDLYLECKNIDWLPAGLQINGSLWLKYATITEFPKDLQVNTHLDLCDTKITKLPDDLYVGNTIYVGSDQIELINFIKGSKLADKLLIEKD